MMSDSMPLFPLSDGDASIGLSVRDLLRQFFKYWATVTACLVTVTALTWGALVLQPAFYESSAKVLVRTEQQGTPSFLSGITAYREPQDPEPIDRKIETEIQLLMSRSNADAVVKQLGITKSQLIQAPIDNLRSHLPNFLRSSKPESAAQIQNQTVTLFMKALSAEPLRSKTADTTSNVFEVRFASVDKTLASRALDAILQQYIRFGAQHSRELGESTFRLIDEKTREEGAEVQALDDKIQALTIRHDSRPDVGGNAGEGQNLALPNPRNASQSSLALLKSQVIDMQAKLEAAKQSFSDDSPPVTHLTEQLREVQDRLRTGARASAELDGEIERLGRQRDLAVERFKELRTKRDQIDLYLQLNPIVADTRLITEPPIAPDRPNVKIKLVLGLLGPLAGLLIGLVIAGLRDYFDHRLQDAEDVKRYLGLETLGILPRQYS